ncbi:hypothetical protein [Pseudomonas sp. PS01297]|uniref:hypothetical protein n=1 Tax=Pseudomonas sp. PS01297 TaxID=2991433 RepID=UPI002499D3FD|nr:hypothetical protein [Pseudomonas sp. PS01297]
MKKPKASKHTAVNLITNGDFSAGAEGWASNTGGEVRVVDGVLLLSAANQHSAVQTVTGLSASENYKLTFSYRVRRTGVNDGYVLVNGKRIDSLETVSEGDTFVKSVDHEVTGVTQVDLVFTTSERAVKIDNVVLEAFKGVTHITVSAETVEHDGEIQCTLHAYKLSGAPLVDAQVSWGVESLSISTKSPVERTDAHGKATCTAVNKARPGEQGVGHVTALVLSGADGGSVKTAFLTFKLPKK